MEISKNHVSDARLTKLIGFLERPDIQKVSAGFANEVLVALLELKQRRAEARFYGEPCKT